jgi:hypothetical protein
MNAIVLACVIALGELSDRMQEYAVSCPSERNAEKCFSLQDSEEKAQRHADVVCSEAIMVVKKYGPYSKSAGSFTIQKKGGQ